MVLGSRLYLEEEDKLRETLVLLGTLETDFQFTRQFIILRKCDRQFQSY